MYVRRYILLSRGLHAINIFHLKTTKNPLYKSTEIYGVFTNQVFIPQYKSHHFKLCKLYGKQRYSQLRFQFFNIFCPQVKLSVPSSVQFPITSSAYVGPQNLVKCLQSFDITINKHWYLLDTHYIRRKNLFHRGSSYTVKYL